MYIAETRYKVHIHILYMGQFGFVFKRHTIIRIDASLRFFVFFDNLPGFASSRDYRDREREILDIPFYSAYTLWDIEGNIAWNKILEIITRIISSRYSFKTHNRRQLLRRITSITAVFVHNYSVEENISTIIFLFSFNCQYHQGTDMYVCTEWVHITSSGYNARKIIKTVSLWIILLDRISCRSGSSQKAHHTKIDYRGFLYYSPKATSRRDAFCNKPLLQLTCTCRIISKTVSS